MSRFTFLHGSETASPLTPTPDGDGQAPGIAIASVELENVSKSYHLFDRPQDRLAALFPLSQRPNRFRIKTALEGLSLRLHPGDAIGVIGRNGAGKSTLLQLIAGVLQPSSGEVRVRGRVLALLELGTGFNSEFTGRQNVTLTAALYGLSLREGDPKLKAIEAFAGIGDYFDEPVKTYSTGMAMRLAFAVAIHVEPEILIIDEAFSVGDAVFMQRCMRWLHDFRSRGILILVSHSLEAVNSLCHTALWLERGRVRQTGTAKEVTEHYLASCQAESAEGGEAFTISPVGGRLEFGDQACAITEVSLTDGVGRSITTLQGGESLQLSISITARQPCESLILGFHFKNRLGLILFGENTLAAPGGPHCLGPGESAQATFAFRAPRLPDGTYTIDAAVARGSQRLHAQAHWIYDALKVTSLSGHESGGLIGLPMEAVHFEPTPATPGAATQSGAGAHHTEEKRAQSG